MSYLPEAESFNFCVLWNSDVEGFVDSSPLKRNKQREKGRGTQNNLVIVFL